MSCYQVPFIRPCLRDSLVHGVQSSKQACYLGTGVLGQLMARAPCLCCQWEPRPICREQWDPQ